MIIGKGLIANAFEELDNENVLIFASGVSKSSEVDAVEFNREKKLLLESLKLINSELFVYFSTASIYDDSSNQSQYVLHKIHMEELIKEKAENFLILRVSNAVGKTGNKNTLFNYLKKAIQNEQEIFVYRNATRSFIDVIDLSKIISVLIEDTSFWNTTQNVAHPSNFRILEIIEIMEKEFQKSAKIVLANKGCEYEIPLDEKIYSYFAENNLLNKHLYLKKMIRKYL